MEKMTVVHSGDPTTKVLTQLYEQQGDVFMITENNTNAEVTHAVKACEKIMMLGHGNMYGLFSTRKKRGDFMEISMGINQTSASIEKPEKRGELHVGQLWERYPCFDLSDYATERRFYQNYIIRKEPIRETEILQLKKFRISERIPLDMLPMVYYVGDGGFMLVATCRE